jgi:hypothetical protein
MSVAVRSILFLYILFGIAPSLSAQEGYEYEVYSTHIAAPRASALELHTNFVPTGPSSSKSGLVSTNHAVRSSLEFSRGINRWLEGSFYFVGGVFRGTGAEYVGNRVRLTAVAPSTWNLPFDLGVSQEVGYARRGFGEHRWMYEISPIIGKTFGRVSLTANPALERGFGGAGESELELEPRAKASYEIGDDGALALEYFGALGPAKALEPAYEQHHQLFVTFQTRIGRRWEIGGGIGRGLTRNSDRTVLTSKLEYHFGH